MPVNIQFFNSLGSTSATIGLYKDVGLTNLISSTGSITPGNIKIASPGGQQDLLYKSEY